MLSRIRSSCILILVISLVLIVNRCTCTANGEETNLNPLTKYTMQFIVEYAHWRRLDHIIIFDPFLNQGNIPINLMQLVDCLSEQSIYSTIYSTNVKFTPETFRIIRHRLGVIVLLKCNETFSDSHVLYRASENHLLDEQHAWLLITCEQDGSSIISLTRTTNLALTTDLVIATSLLNHTMEAFYDNIDNNGSFTCPVTFQKREKSVEFETEVQIHPQLSTNKSQLIYGPSDGKLKINFPEASLIFSMNLNTTDTSADDVPETLFYKLTQVYKIRRSINASIVLNFLGLWDPKDHFDKIAPFRPVEKRHDLMGFPLTVGYKKWKTPLENEVTKRGRELLFETDVDDFDNLRKIMDFIATSLNASVEYVPFQTIGSEIHDGDWTGLLKAVVEGEVDLGMEEITVSYRKSEQMAFTYKIMKLGHHLYMHPSDLGVSQDIYLTPFSMRLLFCVLGMAILLALVMLFTSAAANYKAKKNNEDTENINWSYASLWIVGILSMQGSVWTPVSSSGNMTLLSSLMFALVIYNSYAAFITSILSVRTSNIESIEDLYANGYKIGFIRDSEDEMYLQKRKDSLKKIFNRGDDSKADSIEEGLLLAARTKYALFVSSQAARKVIQDLKPYECRCQIEEFLLEQTIEEVAFPLNKSSPYLKVINLGVLRLIESGILSRIEESMLPTMPTCSEDSSFVSAQLDDVLTAVKLLGLGMMLSIIVLIGECVTKYRKSLRYNFKICCRQIGVTVKNTVENFEF